MDSDFVKARAAHRCEYCHLPQSGHAQPFSIDHIIARKHRGGDDASNLALCCLRCNLHKGTDLSSIDPATGLRAELFNPRTQQWDQHFGLEEARIIGLTPTGRATTALLHMNIDERVRLRALLIQTDQFPA